MTKEHHKDAAGVKIFPPGVPLTIIIAGFVLDWRFPIAVPSAPPPLLRYIVGGGVILLAIALLGFWSVRTMRQTGQSENPYKPTTEIVASGPFRFTRNPMYLQMVIACVGFAVLTWNAWIAMLTPLCWAALNYLVIVPEERYLERKFGDEYVDYKKRVRRWL